MQNFEERLRTCVRQEGRHLSAIIFRNWVINVSNQICIYYRLFWCWHNFSILKIKLQLFEKTCILFAPSFMCKDSTIALPSDKKGLWTPKHVHAPSRPPVFLSRYPHTLHIHIALVAALKPGRFVAEEHRHLVSDNFHLHYLTITKHRTLDFNKNKTFCTALEPLQADRQTGGWMRRPWCAT